MKNLLLLTALVLCNITYSQVNEKSLTKNKYAGMKPKMPDSTQILKRTPSVLLKQKFEVVNYHNPLQVTDNRNTTKPKFNKVLPSSTTP